VGRCGMDAFGSG